MPAACLQTVRASLTNGSSRDRAAHASHWSSRSGASSGLACSRMMARYSFNSVSDGHAAGAQTGRRAVRGVRRREGGAMTVRAPLGPLLCAGAAGRDPSDGRQSMPANVGPYVDPIWVALQDVMQKRAIFIGGPRWDRTSDTLIKRSVPADPPASDGVQWFILLRNSRTFASEGVQESRGRPLRRVSLWVSLWVSISDGIWGRQAS